MALLALIGLLVLVVVFTRSASAHRVHAGAIVTSVHADRGRQDSPARGRDAITVLQRLGGGNDRAA